MITTIPAALFKDCSTPDFEHYFNKTMMVWNISPTKRRIFICEGISGYNVVGNYLTRQRELKPKSFSWDAWWKSLDIIPPFTRIFNLNTAAGYWSPSLQKNLKKSFPSVTMAPPGTIKIFGKPDAEEVSVQNLLASTFDDFYGRREMPSFRDALQREAKAIATKGDFIIDKLNKEIYFKNTVIGGILEGGKVRIINKYAREAAIEEGGADPTKLV